MTGEAIVSTRGRKLWLTVLLGVLTVLVLASVALFGTGWRAGRYPGSVASLASFGALAILWLAGRYLRAEIRRTQQPHRDQPA
jgi:hypothetical protein